MKNQRNTNMFPIIVATVLTIGFVAWRVFADEPTLTVYAPAIVGSGGSGTGCPGAFSGYINYTQAIPTWGWAPVPGLTNYSASNGGQRSDAKVEFIGLYGDTGCNLSSVIVPSPMSPAYVFAIYFTSNPPTTNYPIILTGFSTTNS